MVRANIRRLPNNESTSTIPLSAVPDGVDPSTSVQEDLWTSMSHGGPKSKTLLYTTPLSLRRNGLLNWVLAIGSNSKTRREWRKPRPPILLRRRPPISDARRRYRDEILA